VKNNAQVLGSTFAVAALLAVVALVYSVSHLLAPIILGLLLGYIVYPVIRIFSRIGLPRGIGVLLIFLIIVSCLAYSVSILLPLVRSEIELLTDSRATTLGESKIYEIINNISEQLYEYRLISERFDAPELIERLRDFLRTQSRLYLGAAGDAAAQIGQFVMIFLFVFTYTLLDGHKINRTLIGLMPNAMFELGTLMLHRTGALFGAYLRGLVIENLILGVVAFLMLIILSVFVPLNAALCLLIALTIALTNVVRIIGPFIGAGISVIYILVSGADLIAIAGVAVVAVLVQLLDNILVLPLVMKDQVNVHPVVSLLSVIAGGSIGGVLGMIIAIPVAGALNIVIQIMTVERKRFQID